MAKKYQDRETARTVEWVAQEYELMARVFDDIDEAGLGGAEGEEFELRNASGCEQFVRALVSPGQHFSAAAPGR